MTLRDQLLAKRANYQTSLHQLDIQVLQSERALKAAKKKLRTAREARAGAKIGLQVMEETLVDLEKHQAEASKVVVKPAPIIP